LLVKVAETSPLMRILVLPKSILLTNATILVALFHCRALPKPRLRSNGEAILGTMRVLSMGDPISQSRHISRLPIAVAVINTLLEGAGRVDTSLQTETPSRSITMVFYLFICY